MVRNCQECGNPMFSRNDMGTNDDGSVNKDFCSNCYRDGEFAQDRDRTGQGSVNVVVPFMGTMGLNTNSSIGYGGTTPGSYVPFAVDNEIAP